MTSLTRRIALKLIGFGAAWLGFRKSSSVETPRSGHRSHQCDNGFVEEHTQSGLAEWSNLG